MKRVRCDGECCHAAACTLLCSLDACAANGERRMIESEHFVAAQIEVEEASPGAHPSVRVTSKRSSSQDRYDVSPVALKLIARRKDTSETLRRNNVSINDRRRIRQADGARVIKTIESRCFDFIARASGRKKRSKLERCIAGRRQFFLPSRPPLSVSGPNNETGKRRMT